MVVTKTNDKRNHINVFSEIPHVYFSWNTSKDFLFLTNKNGKDSRRLFDKKDEKWEISNIFILILQTKLRARAWILH